jgi:RNA polymerase sigma-70 factor (ECF subfamily)
MADSSPLTEPEILTLVRQAQEGDAQAFSALYDHFFQQVYRYTAFRLDREVAEDLVADIFLKVWEKLHTYEERAGVPFGAWLFRIARHEVIDAYRARRETEEVPEEMSDPDPMNRADDRVKRGELLRIVRRAMDRLPRRYRDILLLSYMADLPHSEIAQTLKMREGAVRVLKFRALQKLESLLPPETRALL